MSRRFNCALFCAMLLVLSLTFSAWGTGLDAFSTLEGKIDIAGGTAHIPVMKEAAKQIMTANPAIRITVAGGGTGVGVQKVGEGLVDIGNTGRSLSPEEIEKYGLQSFPFAIDGVAAIVHPSNPVTGLSSEQIQAIFAGTITNWQELGGPDQPINLYTRDEASGTREVFWKKLLQKGSIAERANVVASNGAMKVAISQDPAAIGYMSIGHLDESVKGIEVDGAAPTQDNAINGSYKIVRKLYMNTKGEPSPLVKAFIDYICGAEGTPLISAAGYIPLQ